MPIRAAGEILEIPVLSAGDPVIVMMSLNRGNDWVDIEAMVAAVATATATAAAATAATPAAATAAAATAQLPSRRSFDAPSSGFPESSRSLPN